MSPADLARLASVGLRSRKLRAALSALGATGTVPLGGDAGPAGQLGQAAAEVDVVLDYLWGQPAAEAMAAIVTGPADLQERQRALHLPVLCEPRIVRHGLGVE